MASSTFDRLDALSREGPLDEADSLRLERAVRRITDRREQWHWSKADDRRLERYLLGGTKPKTIAIIMKRTERAVWVRMQRLGLGVRKCSIASDGGK